MNAKLKSLKLLNFKGIRSFYVSFDDKETDIHGANATGKTTVYDAFMWLLFGKDSSGRSDFNIKTLDADGVAIEKITHEVEGVIETGLVAPTVLKRVYEEKWVKTRGSAIAEFKGHESTLFVNDVPCSTSEFQSKVNIICPEQIFKFITNPFFFPSQTKEVQRAMLFDLAGGIDEKEIAKCNPDYEALLNQLVGKTLDEYKKEIASKKSKIKEELKGMPERMDECRRGLPEVLNWLELEAKLKIKLDAISKIEEEMIDRSKATKEAGNKQVEAQKEITILKGKLSNLSFSLKTTLQEAWHKQTSGVTDLKRSLDSKTKDVDSLRSILLEWNTRAENLSKKITGMLAQYTAINAEQLVFEPGSFDCPTCKRAFELSDIEAKQSAMTENFNKLKVSRLTDNKTVGLAARSEQTKVLENRDRTATDLAGANAALVILQADYNTAVINEPKEPDYVSLIAIDPEFQKLHKLIEEKEALANVAYEKVDVSDLQESKKTLEAVVIDLRAELNVKVEIKKTTKRIAELEANFRTLSGQLAEYEQIEFNISGFNKAKVEQVESKINGMFGIVKFNLYETQINGGEKEICEASVGGVPFSDLNNAMRINAGLDIIKTLCSKFDYTAPVFIDNRESVSEIIPINSQIINLIVNPEIKVLTIKNNATNE